MILIQLLLFFLPFVVLPFGQSQFELPKIITAVLLIDSLLVYVLIARKKYAISKPFLILVGLFFALTLFDLLFLRTQLSFFGNQFRFQGILLFWQLLLLAVVSSQLPYHKLSWYWYITILFLTLVTGLVFGQNNRSIGTLGEPNAFAAFIVFFWPFVFFANEIKKKYRIFLQIGCLALLFILLFLTGSRSGLIAFGIQIIFYLLLNFKRNLKLALGIGLTLIGFSYFLPNFSHTLYEDRATIWHTAFVAGLSHPLLGSGFGNTEIVLRQVIIQQHNTLIGYYVDSSHNIFLDFWVQSGVVGVLLLITLLVIVVKNFYQRKQPFYLLLLLGLLTVFSFNPLSVVSLVELWWLIGQAFAKPNKLESVE